MTRIACVVIPELPHHVTQRGSRRLPTLPRDGDHRVYRNLLSEQAGLATVAGWGGEAHESDCRPGETGRPLGDEAFVARLEHEAGRRLGSRKPGRARQDFAVED